MIFKWFKRKTNNIDFLSLEKEINKWSIEQAREFIFAVLKDKSKYKTVARQHNNNANFIEFPNQSVASFYDVYEKCEQVYGDASLNLCEVGESEFRSGYIRIARDSDATELVVKKNHDEVYDIDGSESDFEDSPFPSIYHWLAFTSCVVYQDLEVQVTRKTEP